jgi:hypothetical protein
MTARGKFYIILDKIYYIKNKSEVELKTLQVNLESKDVRKKVYEFISPEMIQARSILSLKNKYNNGNSK